MSGSVYALRTGGDPLPVRVLKRGLHLYLVQLVGTATVVWVMPDELVLVPAMSRVVGGSEQAVAS